MWISSDECAHLCHVVNVHLNNSAGTIKKSPEVVKTHLALKDLITRLYEIYQYRSQSLHSGSIKLDLTQTEVPKLVEVMMKNEATKLINHVLTAKLRLRIQHAHSDMLLDHQNSQNKAKLAQTGEVGETAPTAKVGPLVFNAAEAARYVKVKSRVRRKTGESNGSSQGS